MEQELLITASPHEVGLLAKDLTRHAQRNKGTGQFSFGPFHVVNWEQFKSNPNVDLVCVDIEGEVDAIDQMDGVNRVEKLLGFPGRVEVSWVPGDKSRLILTVPDKNWPTVAPNWDLLYQEMEQLGWLISNSPTQSQPTVAPSTAGLHVPPRQPKRSESIGSTVRLSM